MYGLWLDRHNDGRRHSSRRGHGDRATPVVDQRELASKYLSFFRVQ